MLEYCAGEANGGRTLEFLRRDSPVPWLATAGAVLGLALTLHLMGRDLICPCGYVKLWHGEIPSTEGSQHVMDWWTFSHVIHGFLFYLVLHLVVPRWSFGWRLFAATLIEVAWEVFENTAFTIERYRTSTIAFDYNGDSVLNSVADVGAMLLGFLLASRLPVWMSVAIVVAMEVFTGFFIRDGLMLNVVTFVYPAEIVLDWQRSR
jgi:hypothetical protein